MSSGSHPAAKRADLIDLIGPDFDQAPSDPAARTLIICSAPRTGSYELCRYLVAVGIGVPHAYFNPNYARRLAERWGFPADPLVPNEIGRYIEMLRRRRAQGGVFATRLQYRHLEGALRNHHGSVLFDGACVVHLFRPDVATQFASLRAALQSGVWDFSGRQTTPPVAAQEPNSLQFLRQALAELDWLAGEDASFRALFIMLGIRPVFVTSNDLFADPRTVVHRIAQALDVPVDARALDDAIAVSAPCGHERGREQSMTGLAEKFRELAFERRGRS